MLAYNPKSRFAPQFAAAARGKTPWYEVLATPGVRFGRGDPTIDPKDTTLFLFTLAGKHYGRPDIPALLGEPLNPAQVLPEVALLARIDAGQFDAGIFYKHEIVAHQLPFVSFPPEINLGDARFAALYAQATYTSPAGERVAGAPILFTITIPTTTKDPAAAEEFVRFLFHLARYCWRIRLRDRAAPGGRRTPANAARPAHPLPGHVFSWDRRGDRRAMRQRPRSILLIHGAVGAFLLLDLVLPIANLLAHVDAPGWLAACAGRRRRRPAHLPCSPRPSRFS